MKILLLTVLIDLSATSQPFVVANISCRKLNFVNFLVDGFPVMEIFFSWFHWKQDFEFAYLFQENANIFNEAKQIFGFLNNNDWHSSLKDICLTQQ